MVLDREGSCKCVSPSICGLWGAAWSIRGGPAAAAPRAPRSQVDHPRLAQHAVLLEEGAAAVGLRHLERGARELELARRLGHDRGEAARELAKEGIEVEIIDLRSLSPYDWDAISATVKKTNKVIIAHEDHLSWGYGGEIAARIADELFEYLDGPVRRVCGKDCFVAYAPVLEDEILPQVDDLVAEARALHAY